ncbi:MAG: leucine-rich repeat domain-containing protein, partial [Oscillospiraceae bacterium]|nr:leucine-rich repeat domain-containing protein [Oscillospiraceae bacterium]
MRKRFVCVLLILVLSLALLPTTAFADEEIVVTKENFPDDNFRKYIIDRYCASGGVLYASVIESAEYISVSNREIRSLKGIELFPHLETLECGGNALSELDLSANPELKSLDCSENALTKLNVSGNSALTFLNCSMNKLSKLDVSGNGALTWLNCCSNQLTALDVSGNPALERLECGWNRLSSLDVSGNPALECLRCN